MGIETSNWLQDFSNYEWFNTADPNRPNDIENLIDATRLELAPGVSTTSLGRELNSLVSSSMGSQISALKSMDELKSIRKLTKAVTDYIDLSERMATSGTVLARVPKERHSQFASQLAEFNSSIRSKANQPAKIWQDRFFPRCLGLYATAFGVVPKSTYNESTGRGPTPTLDFFDFILAHVGKQQSAKGFDAFLGPTKTTRTLSWGPKELGTIRYLIANGLRFKAPDLNGGFLQFSKESQQTKRETLQWEVSRDFFNQVIIQL